MIKIFDRVIYKRIKSSFCVIKSSQFHGTYLLEPANYRGDT